jgi:hypothetical protein
LNAVVEALVRSTWGFTRTDGAATDPPAPASMTETAPSST